MGGGAVLLVILPSLIFHGATAQGSIYSYSIEDLGSLLCHCSVEIIICKLEVVHFVFVQVNLWSEIGYYGHIILL